MAHYLMDQMCKFYYDEIKKRGSDESDVDNFYNTVLHLYFPSTEMYGVEQESRPARALGYKDRTDFTIRCIRNGKPKKVVVMECKRREYETQSGMWKSALDQALYYVSLIREESGQDDESPIYVMVAIGTHVRAYIHPEKDHDVEAFHLHPNELLELAKDEQKIHDIFMELKRLTAH